jgi:diguanylate cyclase (GGDEF)-like protein
VNWSELPDLAAVALLAGAFVSVARRNHTEVSRVWLVGWIMIVIHFAASIFTTVPGIRGTIAESAALIALIWAGLLFMWASIPYRNERSSPWMGLGLAATNALYVILLQFDSVPNWALSISAILIGAVPLILALSSVHRFNHPLRWGIVTLYCILSFFALGLQAKPQYGRDLALNAVLFAVFFGCCFHFWFAYRRATAGAYITIAGFFAWASVFVIAPLMDIFRPDVHIEGEVWNLPKYVVAVGMILLLLEDQIEHNRHLALHDHLTGLPNRRLYQDRLANALERARRSETQAALLVVDLDRFKQVNDTLGHHVGDLVLQQVAEMFAARVRRSDTVARTGGDEFSVILEEPISRDEAEQVGQTLIELLDQPLLLAGQKIRIGASVGIAVYPEDARQMESLCIAADLKMYESKHNSRDLREQLVFSVSGSIPALKPKAQVSIPGTESR